MQSAGSYLPKAMPPGPGGLSEGLLQRGHCWHLGDELLCGSVLRIVVIAGGPVM